MSSVHTVQDFASAGANMYTFHLEAVVPDATDAKHPVEKMEQVLKEVKDAGEARAQVGTAGHVCLCSVSTPKHQARQRSLWRQRGSVKPLSAHSAAALPPRFRVDVCEAFIAHNCFVEFAAAVPLAGMHAGVALKPKTPAETLFPYIKKKLIDMVRHQVAEAARKTPFKLLH